MQASSSIVNTRSSTVDVADLEEDDETLVTMADANFENSSLSQDEMVVRSCDWVEKTNGNAIGQFAYQTTSHILWDMTQ